MIRLRIMTAIPNLKSTNLAANATLNATKGTLNLDNIDDIVLALKQDGESRAG